MAEIPWVGHVYRVTRSQRKGVLRASYDQLRKLRALEASLNPVQRYDLAIAPRWEAADAIFSTYAAYLSNAEVRLGYSGKVGGASESSHLLLTHVVQGGEGQHESQRYTRLLHTYVSGPSDPRIRDTSRQPLLTLMQMARARQNRDTSGSLPVMPYFVLCPGATSAMRRWPAESFAQVARALIRTQSWTAVVVGAPSEKELCLDLTSRIGQGAVCYAGKTTTLQMFDVIAGAQFLLGNDSGPAHMAGALNVPTFVLSPFPMSSKQDHLNNPVRFHPLGQHTHVFQPARPLDACSITCESEVAHCILQIAPACVIERILQSLSPATASDQLSA